MATRRFAPESRIQDRYGTARAGILAAANAATALAAAKANQERHPARKEGGDGPISFIEVDVVAPAHREPPRRQFSECQGTAEPRSHRQEPRGWSINWLLCV